MAKVFHAPALPDLSSLEERLGYRFRDQSLLGLALSHVSATSRRDASYQRLEFLGDRVLGLSVAEMLFRDYPAAAEGELSRRLAELVRKETCARVAADWNVSHYIRLGAGEAQSGGAQKVAILGDVCEAIIGAVFLDSSFDEAADLVERSFQGQGPLSRPALRDPKSALQEWAQGRGIPAPVYRLEGQDGPDHAPHFTIAAEVAGFPSALGEGASKRAAEQASAETFLEREKIWPDQKDPA